MPLQVLQRLVDHQARMRDLARRADEYTYLQHSINEATARMKQLDSVLLGVETELRRAESSLVCDITHHRP